MADVRQLAAFLAAVLVTSPAYASADLAKAKNCVACHHAERKIIGPPYKAIAAKYANDDTAVRALSEKILKGGSGNWGQMPMPAQSNVSQDEAEALAQWILSHQ